MPSIKPKQYKRIDRKKDSESDSWHNTKKFKSLTAKWYKKLEKSGFQDIEEFGGVEEERLKAHHNMRFFPMYESGEFDTRQRYYELATQLLYTYPFESETDRKIWELHTEGVSNRKIFKIVKKSYYYVTNTVKLITEAIKRDAKDILEDKKAV